MARNDFIVPAFRRQVEADPQSACLVYEGTTWSREQVWSAAVRTAASLRASGFEERNIAAVHLPRSPEVVVAMLGIAMAGGIYAPIDVRLPTARVRKLLELLEPRAFASLASAELFRDINPIPTFGVSMDPTSEGTSTAGLPVGLADDHPAYIICTSGSTGGPKAVLTSHRALANYTRWAIEHFRLAELEAACFSTGIGFDASLVTQLLPLLAGLPITIAPEGEELTFLGQLLDPGRSWSGLIKIVPSQLDALSATIGATMAAGVNRDARSSYVLGGEPLTPSSIAPWMERFPRGRFFNQYGPTEATIACSCHRIVPADLDRKAIPIGRPIPNASLTIVDDDLQPLAAGSTGEILIAGEGVAEGYVRGQERENARFQRDATGRAIAYRTGDLAFEDEDGVFHFVGRNDDQIKLRGYRIELGEIRSQLASWPALTSCTVVLHKTDRIAQLVAFGVARSDAAEFPTPDRMKDYLAEILPPYMIPSRLVILPELPLTTSGKADHRALLDTLTKAAAASNETTDDLAQRLGAIWDELLGCGTPQPRDSFFELGGDSIKAVQLAARVTEALGVELSAPQIFDTFRFGDLCDLLAGAGQPASPHEATGIGTPSPEGAPGASAPIAIIGAAVDLPGAESIEAYWDNLIKGREAITFFADDDLDPRVREAASHDDYVRARGLLESDASTFDAAFFGYSAREASLMDPQHRRFLEVAWQTLESGGYASGVPQQIGVFAGCAIDTYTMQNVIPRAHSDGTLLDLRRQILNDKDYLPLRVSHKLNLNGPSLSINTACSTSLVAVATAVQALRQGQCAMALAGGASIDVPIQAGYRYTEGSMLSPDGHTRPFSEDAAGTVFNAGIGAVLLKPLDRALADGDPVLGVIRGVGISNDGADKASFAAPTITGQRAAIETALRDARVDPKDIAFVEAHGTATPIGDPIEIEALQQAMGDMSARTAPCWIGSVKSNIGHVVAAAGVAGLIKATLSLRHRTLPASVNFVAPNPALKLDGSGFEIAAETVPLSSHGGPLRCGVSSFGLGGTNAHVVLEEPPAEAPSGPSPRPCEILVVSGKSDTALADNAQALASWLDRHPSAPLADVAYTLMHGRKAFEHCAFVTASDRSDAIEQLRAVSGKSQTAKQPLERTVFMFSGQGAQAPHMGADLFHGCAVYRSAFDECAQIAREIAGLDLEALIYGEAANPEQLQDTRYAQPALFAVEYALAQRWLHWGLQPAAVIGHSIGEYVAACIAGIMSLEAALTLVIERGRLLSRMPTGSMLSVRLDEERLRDLLPDDLDLSGVNSSTACVVSGTDASIQRFADQLAANDIPCTPLHTSHAFHSRMMAGALEPFGEAVADVALQPAKIPFIPTARSLDSDGVKPEMPAYWVNQIAAPVRFAEAVREAAEGTPALFLEIGPRRVLAQLAPGSVEGFGRTHRCVASLGGGREEESDWASLLRAFGTAWANGLPLDLGRFFAGEQRQRLRLPGYRFQRQRYWVDPVKPERPAETRVASTTPDPTVARVLSEAGRAEGAASSGAQDASGLDRTAAITEQVREVLREHTGLELLAADDGADFFELGLDSLSLTQVASQLSRIFDVMISFRQLTLSESNVGAVAAYLDEQLPADAVEVSAQGADASQEEDPLAEALLNSEENQPYPITPDGPADRDARQPPPLDGTAGHDALAPPVPGARLGRDPNGNPAWYVKDEKRPGEYRKLEPA